MGFNLTFSYGGDCKQVADRTLQYNAMFRLSSPLH